ncbi:uncharacterized protein [Henckelia pumila]|uniref:uncharacterized protein n=1 Tax=Henckelia pumila TaxID=405737 RepID=UPI003C6E795C
MSGRGRGRGRGNVADMTVDQLSQFITQTVQAAMGQNPPPPVAQQWFNLLQPGSLRSFNDFSLAFLHQFASSKKYLKTSLSLFNLKQSEVEPLREYVQRFNTAALEVPAATADTLVNSFTQWMRGGEFFKSLIKKSPLTYDELLSRAEKYVNLEDAQRQRRQEGTSGSKPNIKIGKKVEGKAEVGRKRVAEEMNRAKGPYPYVPLSVSLDKAMQVCEDRRELVRPRNAEKGPRLQPSDKFCDFHKEYCHITNDCQRLGEEVQRIISEDARLRAELAQRANPPRQGRDPQWRNQGNKVRGNQPDHQRRAPQNGQKDRVEQIGNHPHRGMINMISGGTTDGDSGRARKAHGFGREYLKDVVVPHNDPLLVTLTIANYDVARIFVDTGSSVNIIFKETLDQMKLEGFELDPITTELYGFTGHALQLLGQIVLPLSLGNGEQRVTKMACFTVVDAPSSFNGILGRPALSDFRAVESTYHQKLKFPSGRDVGVVRGDQKAARLCYVNEVKIDANKKKREVEMVLVGRTSRVFGQKVLLMFEEGHEKVELSPGAQIVKLAADLVPSVKQRLVDCLKKNKDVFAWSVSELTGISAEIMVHRLNILAGVRPIKQKKRHFGPEKDKVIKKEVDELFKSGHIREVQFPTWLSNVVLVPKSSGKWRMCVDFRDLNKACPKDCYPLPRIDQLVDSTAGHQYLCFMDAYQGYHQIPLAKEDQDKVSFTTSHGTFCYRVMPFGLKNAGAIYQRLMDKVFASQIFINVEVYVDDILGKSQDDVGLLADLEETFSTLRTYQVKLNPEKCVFGVRRVKFLGYMVTERGIEANPEKVQAIRSMSDPRNLQEVQRLVGRIAALSRFISRSAHRSLPFFKVLRKAKKFEWDDECGKAFEDLKIYLAELPVLAKAISGEPLYIYLSALEEAVSSVLIRQEGETQDPIYFFSHALKGAELRYSEVEKLVLALVMTARKLRPYFLSHPIVVLTNSPIGRILTRVDISGRLVKRP